jgi:hypothetical protein
MANATPSASSASGSKPAQAAPAPQAPFRRGTIRTLLQDGYQQTATLGSSTQVLPQYSPTPNAYLRGLWINTANTVTSNTASVTFNGDGPWNVYSSIVFADANQKPIVGPLSGYQLMVANKFGGYQYNDDPRASAVYSTTVGTGGTAGSFQHVLYVPLEVDSRDTLGSLQNKSASSAFQLQLTLNTEANVYTQAPMASGATIGTTVTVNVLEDGYLQPKSTDTSGNPLAQAPPQLGSTQYWTFGSYNALNSSQQVQLTQGLGYPIRQMVAINYDVSANTRAAGDGDFPTSTQFIFRGTTFWNVLKNIWKDQMSRQYGFYSATADSANGLENGVYALAFNNDFGLQDGDELRNAYLVTQQGDQFQLVGTFSGNSNLQWLVNYVAPAAGPQNAASIQAG